MFEQSAERSVTTEQLSRMTRALSRLDQRVEDAERIDQIRLLEELKSAAAAAQAQVASRFVVEQEAAQRAAGVPAKDVGKGIAAQVALARRESPARARRYVGWARVLTRELPSTFAALQQGRITEWRAQIVARETAWLSVEHRSEIDRSLVPAIEAWGDRQVEAETKKMAYRLDPHGFMARISKAEADRRVTLRPAPDTMSVLSGLLPVAQGVAVYAVLTTRADSLRSQGDERSRGQLMADTLVELVTGQVTAAAVPVEVNLVMTDQTLFNAGPASDEPAHIEGFGPIPADLARRLVLAADGAVEAWVRRLYTGPDTGDLVAMDSRRRPFRDTLRKFLVVRDQLCRTLWCGAPIRHIDHVVGVDSDGVTSAGNGQGLCEACNYAKEAAGWHARASGRGVADSVEVTTPTGHTYRSRPPDPPGTRTAPGATAVEEHLRRLLVAA